MLEPAGVQQSDTESEMKKTILPIASSSTFVPVSVYNMCKYVQQYLGLVL